MKAMKWLVMGFPLVAGLGRGQVALDADDLDVVALRAPQALEAAVASVPEWVEPAPVALSDSMGSEFPEPEIAGWATLDAPGRESAQVAAFRPLTLAESDWRRPSTYQVAGVVPWLGNDSAGLVFLVEGAAVPDPEETHWERHGWKYITGGSAAGLLLLTEATGVTDITPIGKDDEKKPPTPPEGDTSNTADNGGAAVSAKADRGSTVNQTVYIIRGQPVPADEAAAAAAAQSKE